MPDTTNQAQEIGCELHCTHHGYITYFCRPDLNHELTLVFIMEHNNLGK